MTSSFLHPRYPTASTEKRDVISKGQSKKTATVYVDGFDREVIIKRAEQENIVYVVVLTQTKKNFSEGHIEAEIRNE